MRDPTPVENYKKNILTFDKKGSISFSYPTKKKISPSIEDKNLQFFLKKYLEECKWHMENTPILIEYTGEFEDWKMEIPYDLIFKIKDLLWEIEIKQKFRTKI